MLDLGPSLAVQQLKLCTCVTGGLGSIPHGGTKVPRATWHSQQKKACSSQAFSLGDKAGTQYPSSRGDGPALQRWARGVGAGTRLSQGSPASWVASQSFLSTCINKIHPPPSFSLLGSLLQWAPVLLGVLGAKEEHKVSSMGESIF